MPLRIGVDLEADDLSELQSIEESMSGLADLEVKISELADQQRELAQRNTELQRVCAQIVQREKQQSVANAAATEEKHDKEPGNGLEAEGTAADNDAEKKHHFEETLELIRAAHHRLARQKTEAEHIAADLQARLDDKKSKADEIGKTFRVFKRFGVARQY